MIPRILYTIPGVNEANAPLIHQAALALLRAQASKKPVIGSWDKLIDYLHASLAHSPVEQFQALYLDRQNRLIADEILSTGTVNHCPVYPRTVAARALEHHASAVIIAHNHPSGSPKPSESDIDMTRQVNKALQALDITLHDHVIIGHGQHFSFQSKGLLQ